MVLKARQFGFSTLILGLLFLDTIQNPQTQTVVVAHDAESTERLFQIVQRFYEHLPEGRKPRTKYANRREFLWPDLGSAFYVGQAGSRAFGRGSTIQNLLMSEVAFWPDAGELVSGLLQAVPRSGNVFVESTANGMGNWFYEEYQTAGRGDSAFVPRFYGWNLHAEYKLQSSNSKLQGSKSEPQGSGGALVEWTEEEARLAAAYELDEGQLLWRREKVRELRDRFPQEYPINCREAFVCSGGRVLSEFVPERAPKGQLVAGFVPPREWRHYLVIDPGWKTLAGLFAAVDPEGRIWLYHEHYEGERLPGEHLEILDAYWRAFGEPAYDVLMDPAGFHLRRTDTGHEHPSWADEFRKAGEDRGIEWFRLRRGNNGDPLALRVKRYLAMDMLRVCEHLRWWRWEAERWVRQSPRTGVAAQERRDPERPIDRFNHLMDATRYLCNELPDPLPSPRLPVVVTPEVRVERHLEQVLRARSRR